MVKTPRLAATARPGPPLEIPAHKAKDAPSWRTRLSCVWRGLPFPTTRVFHFRLRRKEKNLGLATEVLLEVVPRRPRSDNRNPPAGELPGSLGGTNPIHRSQTSFQKRLRAPLAGPSRKSPDSGSHPSGSNGAQPSASEGPARNGGGGGRLNSLHCAPTYWPASALRGRPLSAAQSSPAPADQVMIFGRSWC